MYGPFSVPASVRTHLPLLPLLALSLPPVSRCPSHSVKADEGSGWEGGGNVGGVSWNTEGSLSGTFSYGFLQASILNTLSYNIFSYSTGMMRGQRAPLPSKPPPPHPPFLTHFPAIHIMQKNPNREQKSCSRNVILSFRPLCQ